MCGGKDFVLAVTAGDKVDGKVWVKPVLLPLANCYNVGTLVFFLLLNFKKVFGLGVWRIKLENVVGIVGVHGPKVNLGSVIIEVSL